MWVSISEKYEASIDGHIRNKKTKKVLKEFVGKDGYVRTKFDGKTRLVHRVIAFAFVASDVNSPFINHKDGNKQNNSVDNLEWCNQSENIKHAWETGLSTKENHSKYGKVAHFDSNGNLIKIYQCPSVASEESGVNYFTILNSAKKKTKSKNGYWRFIENCNDYPEREYAAY